MSAMIRHGLVRLKSRSQRIVSKSSLLTLPYPMAPVVRPAVGKGTIEIVRHMTLWGATPPGFTPASRSNFFSGSHVDKMSHKRTDADWIKAQKYSPRVRFLLFAALKPMLAEVSDPVDSRLGRFRTIAWATLDEVQKVVDLESAVTVFLGTERASGRPLFCLDLTGGASAPSPLQDGVQPQLFENDERKFRSMLPTAFQLSSQDAGVVAFARSMLCWHADNTYCPVCGSRTAIFDAGFRKKCVSPGCAGRRGLSTAHPRVDPVMIALVVSPDGDRCLLGRSKSFPPGLYSCLSGFLEPGESLEEGVRREVYEESGVLVGPVQYHSSQMWPFPSSLMLGCLAFAKTDVIKVVEDELESVRWFTHREAVSMFKPQERSQGGLHLPPSQAIAHQLIKSWATAGISRVI
eukprot:Clim_evm18s11 gene=Clim_evmTU18s11